MNLIKRVSMRLVGAFLPEAAAGACIPPEFCFCTVVGGRTNKKVYSNCVGHCTLIRENC